MEPDTGEVAAGGEVVALEAKAVEKTFGGSHALAGVDLTLIAGEIHALLGENGSGKSTLIKILSGFHAPDGNTSVRIYGSDLAFASPESAYRLGARFIHQDLGLIGSLTVVDNLALGVGYPTRIGTISARAALAEARRSLERVGLDDVDPMAKLEDLTAAERTGVAVARALQHDLAHPVRVLVLDEPTATLPPQEVDHLFATMQRVADQGIAILFVTHNIDEVFLLANRATVLRDGSVVASARISDVTRRQLVRWLVGDAVSTPSRSAGPECTAAHALRVTGLVSGRLRDVSFSAHGGEVVGFAGLTGSGRETLLGAIFGAKERIAGEVTVAGRGVRPGRPAQAMAAGVAYLSPNRKIDGGFMEMTAVENLIINDLKPYANWWWVRGRAALSSAQEWFERLDVRPKGGLALPLAAFSGGNQQKVLFAKWLRTRPAVFLLDEPTQGVDIGAKAELHRHLLAAADAGALILVSSTDIDELVTLCSRVLVIRNGRLASELTGADLTHESIKHHFMTNDATEMAASHG